MDQHNPPDPTHSKTSPPRKSSSASVNTTGGRRSARLRAAKPTPVKKTHTTKARKPSSSQSVGAISNVSTRSAAKCAAAALATSKHLTGKSHKEAELSDMSEHLSDDDDQDEGDAED